VLVLQVKICRDEAGSGALNFVRPRPDRFARERLRDDRGIRGLDRDGLEAGLRGLITSQQP
jgi:hypothetical protein